MTTTFNGWVVTQRIKKETKQGTSYRLKLTDAQKDHKLTLEVTEEEYEKHQIKDELPAGLLKNYLLEVQEKDRKETATGTKLKLTFADDEAGAKLKISAEEADYDNYTIGDPLDEKASVYQQTLDKKEAA